MLHCCGSSRKLILMPVRHHCGDEVTNEFGFQGKDLAWRYKTVSLEFGGDVQKESG